MLQPGASVVQLSLFFLAAAMLMAHWALMAQWPDGVWKKTPRTMLDRLDHPALGQPHNARTKA